MRRIWAFSSGGDANVARRADVYIELVVRTDSDEFPTMGSMVRQIVVKDDGFTRIVEVALDFFQLRHPGTFADIERAVMKGDAVRSIEPRRDHLCLSFSVAFDNRIYLIEHPVADEYGSLVADPQRARIGDTAGVDVDLKSFGEFKLP